MLDCQQIKDIFEQTFGPTHHIQLIGGAEEPLYLPRECVSGHSWNKLIYTLDYPASALHEIAHWCLASDTQLRLKDWGHWYVPDGRTAEQQSIFQRAEVRVQAVEWMLSISAGRPFRESSDNLNGEMPDDCYFRNQIYQQVLNFCQQGFPERARILFNAFTAACGQHLKLSEALFRREALDELV